MSKVRYIRWHSRRKTWKLDCPIYYLCMPCCIQNRSLSYEQSFYCMQIHTDILFQIARKKMVVVLWGMHFGIFLLLSSILLIAFRLNLCSSNCRQSSQCIRLKDMKIWCNCWNLSPKLTCSANIKGYWHVRQKTSNRTREKLLPTDWRSKSLWIELYPYKQAQTVSNMYLLNFVPSVSNCNSKALLQPEFPGPILSWHKSSVSAMNTDVDFIVFSQKLVHIWRGGIFVIPTSCTSLYSKLECIQTGTKDIGGS